MPVPRDRVPVTGKIGRAGERVESGPNLAVKRGVFDARSAVRSGDPQRRSCGAAPRLPEHKREGYGGPYDVTSLSLSLASKGLRPLVLEP